MLSTEEAIGKNLIKSTCLYLIIKFINKIIVLKFIFEVMRFC